MDKKVCLHCGCELIEGENHYEWDSYSDDYCDDCFEKYYGFCDQCAELFQYYDEMLDGRSGVSCKKCLNEYLVKKDTKVKYLIESETHRGFVECPFGKTEAEILILSQRDDPNGGWTSCKEVPIDTYCCKYCGEVTQGGNTDILCRDCRETFGHAFYSEL